MKFLSILTIGAAAFFCVAQEFSIETDKPEALYACGEEAEFSVFAKNKEGKLLTEGSATIYFRKEKQDFLFSEEVDFSKGNPAKFRLTLKEPGFVWCTINNPDNGYYPSPIGAAGFDAEKIVATTENPSDFDEFWQSGIEKTRAIQLDAKITLMDDFSDPDFTGYRVNYANINNTRIYGFLAIPKGEGPFPVIISVPGAGTGNLAPDLNFFRNKNVMTLTLNVHMYDPLKETIAQEFKEVGKGGSYSYIGAPDREKYYHRRSILGINRAFEFVETIPEWDGKHIGVWGSSQGGAYAIIMAALNPDKVTFAASNVPAMCEHTAHETGRSSGWPLLIANTPEGTREMAPYFDVVNFARRVKCPVTVGVGFIDVACGPSSVYAMFNELECEKSIFPSPKMGHSFDKKFLKNAVPAMYQALGVE